MVVYGILHGEKVNLLRAIGLALALLGIIILLLPGANEPNLTYALIMVISGVAWAAYNISGRNLENPLNSTLSNFILAGPFVVIAAVIFANNLHWNLQGVLFAVISGGLASSGAYVLWYYILKKIDRIVASTVQLSVPCLAIVGGSLFIGENIGLRIILSSLVVLCGILLVLFSESKASKETLIKTR